MNNGDTNTLDDVPASSSARAPALPYLFLILECDRPTSGGARYALVDVDEVVLGRAHDRKGTRHLADGRHRLDVRVPGRAMSSTHARLSRDGRDWVLEDARSTNGTFVNGVRVDRAVLGDGDIFELGHTFFRFRGALPTADEPTDLDGRELATSHPGFATLVPSLQSELAVLARAAASPISILLLGETGTGKEVLARSIHAISGRTGPLVAVNCGALPAGLVESQLFGHLKGAFSGAVRDEVGAVRAAHGGTLLLDEIGDLPAAAQPALLRVVQEREVTPVGSARAQKVDVRVVAATHQPLADLSSKGTFRADLLARLDGYAYGLPNLRDRREDIGLIVGSLLAKSGAKAAHVSLTPDAGRKLLTHDWPSNIRELEQALLRGVTFADRDVITVKSLRLGSAGARLANVAAVQSRSSPSVQPTDATFRAELIAHLERHQGNVASVARSLGKARVQIHRWMRKYGIDPSSFRP